MKRQFFFKSFSVHLWLLKIKIFLVNVFKNNFLFSPGRKHLCTKTKVNKGEGEKNVIMCQYIIRWPIVGIKKLAQQPKDSGRDEEILRHWSSQLTNHALDLIELNLVAFMKDKQRSSKFQVNMSSSANAVLCDQSNATIYMYTQHFTTTIGIKLGKLNFAHITLIRIQKRKPTSCHFFHKLSP